MHFSDHLLDTGADVWTAQMEHPFVSELAAGTLADEAFCTWIRQDYRYLIDYASVFAIAGVKARDEETMTRLMGVGHRILADELELHRSFADEHGIPRASLETVEKAPTCVAYTNFLLRTAYEGSIAEIAAAIYPCGQGYLDITDHMAAIATDEHRYTPFIEKYTSDSFRESVAWMREFVDRCAQRYPSEREAMERAFLTSAKLEYRFWEMAYRQETWGVSSAGYSPSIRG